MTDDLKPKVPPKAAGPPSDLIKPEWTEPLVHVLEDYSKVLRSLGHLRAEVLPTPGALPDAKKVEIPVGAAPSTAIVPVVVIAVVVLVFLPTNAAGDSTTITKFVDVCGPKERQALRGAVAAVRKHPELVSATLGLEPHALGRDFAARLAQVEKALA